MLKFYLDTVQYNKEAKEENRSQTKMYKSKEEAEANFYAQVGTDMKNAKLGGSVNIVYDSEGKLYPELTKKWGFMSEDERPNAQPIVTTDDVIAKLIADGKLSQSDIDTAKASLEEKAE